jgi:hypothetical protein
MDISERSLPLGLQQRTQQYVVSLIHFLSPIDNAGSGKDLENAKKAKRLWDAIG